MTNFTPPPPEPQTTANPGPQKATGRPPRAGAVTAITVSLAILGGICLVTTGGTSALAASAQAQQSSTLSAVSTVSTTGVTDLRVDTGGGAVVVQFGDVTEARLTGVNSLSGWSLRRDGSILQLKSPRSVFGWWPGVWFNARNTTTLTLPRELDGTLTADLQLSAGSLDARGDFRSVTADVSAGSLTLQGATPTVTATVQAGDATLDVTDVRSAALSMSAGQLAATFTGDQPDDVKLDVSAGSMDVTLPSGTYDVRKDVSAGNVDNGLDTSGSSPHRVTVSVSAGDVTLHRGR